MTKFMKDCIEFICFVAAMFVLIFVVGTFVFITGKHIMLPWFQFLDKML